MRPRVLALVFVALTSAIACTTADTRDGTEVDRATGSPAGASGVVTSESAVDATGSTRPAASAVLGSRSTDLRSLVCSLPREWLLRTRRGWRADRGPEIQLLPREYDFIGSGLPHVGPWPYVQDVPPFWYGPAQISPRGIVSRPVTVAGIAPTQALLLRFDAFHAPDGIPMREAVAASRDAPRLVVTIVWDAAGRNVLDTWSDAWPYLRSLIPAGTWFDNATVGSSPASTAQIHATIGTETIQPTQMFVNVDELRQNGYTLADVSRWIMGLGRSDATAAGVPLPAGHENDRVFRAAFPSALMQQLPCLPEAPRT